MSGLGPSQILFLPGATGDPSFWKPVADRLAVEASKVLLGYPWFGQELGQGDGQEQAESRGSSVEELVAGIVQRMDRPTALVAQSMGGVLAILSILECRARVTHLVLAATSGGVPVRRLGGSEWQEEFKRNNPAAPDWITSSTPDLSEKIRSITIPTLLLWGDSDPISPVAVGENLLRLLPQSVLQTVPGGDHGLVNVFPEVVAPLIEQHLRKR